MVSHDIIDMITLTGKGHYRQRIEVFLIADPTFTKEEKQKIMKIIDAFSSALPDEKIEKAIINECEKYLNSTLVFKRILGSIRPSFIEKVCGKLKYGCVIISLLIWTIITIFLHIDLLKALLK